MAHPYKSQCSTPEAMGKARYKAHGGKVHSDVAQDRALIKKMLKEHEAHEDEGMARGGRKWIQGAIKHPGALHRDLGVPQGKKIPASKLAKAAHSKNPTIRKRAALAKTLKGMHK